MCFFFFTSLTCIECNFIHLFCLKFSITVCRSEVIDLCNMRSQVRYLCILVSNKLVSCNRLSTWTSRVVKAVGRYFYICGKIFLYLNVYSISVLTLLETKHDKLYSLVSFYCYSFFFSRFIFKYIQYPIWLYSKILMLL